jgi:N-formylglutamate amidohydrolase
MADDVLLIREPEGPEAPVVFDSPHSGRLAPDDGAAQIDVGRLGVGLDHLVDELFAGVPRHGAMLIAARFSRAYIDPNRHEADLDPALLAEPWPGALKPSASARRGRGLIWRYTGRGEEIYARPLTVAEIEARIARYWRPYHDTLAAALDRLHARFGQVWHVNCHSMGAVGRKRHPDPGRERADFTLSDRDGRTCDAEFLEAVRGLLAGMGYAVAINDPYRGMELIRRHGRPRAGRHSLQIEVNRRLYCEEKSGRRTDGFAILQQDLSRLAAGICDYARQATRAGAA